MTDLGFDVGGTVGNPVLNNDKVCQSLRPNDYSIPDRIHKPAGSEYLLEVFRTNVHSVLRSRFYSQGQCWRAGCECIDIQCCGRGDGINSNAVTAEGKTTKNYNDL